MSVRPKNLVEAFAACDKDSSIYNIGLCSHACKRRI